MGTRMIIVKVQIFYCQISTLRSLISFRISRPLLAKAVFLLKSRLKFISRECLKGFRFFSRALLIEVSPKKDILDGLSWSNGKM